MSTVIEAPVVKSTFNPIDYIKSQLLRTVGTTLAVRHTTGTSYRVNWYCAKSNTIIKSVYVTVIGENDDAVLEYPEKQ
jgi:hypothetical protein